jgi:plasmid stability protein
MADIFIRDIPDELAAKLRDAANRHGRSLEAEALELVRRGVAESSRGRFTTDEARARVARSLARFSQVLPSVSPEEMREGLEGTT